jgi:hypothetical protein
MLSNIEIKKVEKKQYDILPEDIYEAEVFDVKEVEDTGYQTDEMEEKIEFTFSILDEKYKGRRLWKKVRAVIADGKNSPKPSELYKILCSLDNLNWGEQEVSAEDINKLIGKKCRIVVKKETSKKGNEYNKITDVLKVKVDKAIEVGEANPEDLPF